jgi:hypothetical protein
VKLLRSYVFWTYDRGSVHYDVMVTVILLFIFVAPRFVNFNDKPALRLPSPSTVEVSSGGPQALLMYQINASALDQSGDQETLVHSMMRVIEPISGGVSLDHYEAVKDLSGKVVAYKVWVTR